ncbi:unnamed protein product [Choristocarpus tenellus]
MLNVRMRGRFLEGGLTVGTIGAPVNLTYDTQNLGLTPSTLMSIAGGKHPFSKVLAEAERPLILYGSSVLEREDAGSILVLLKSLNKLTKASAGEAMDCVHQVSSHANDMGLNALYLESLPQAGACEGENFYCVDLADSGLVSELKATGKTVVYQGTHGDENLSACDVLLPGATFVEKEGTYINTEGRPQRSAKVYPPPGLAREDWKVVRALGQFIGVELPYSTLDEMHERVHTLVPYRMDEVTPSTVGPIPGVLKLPTTETRIHETSLGPLVHDFYRTDAVSRASVTMAKVSAMHRQNATNWIL